jgi:hypothetical protein
MRIPTRRAAAAFALAAGALVLTASVAGASAPIKFQVTVTDISPPPNIRFSVAPVPPEVEPATVKVGFANNSIAPHVLVAVGGLPEGITLTQFRNIVDAVEKGTAPPPEGAFVAGAVFSKPGQDHQKLFDLNTPGQYGFFCPIVGPNNVAHYDEGFIGLFEVVPS